MNSILETDKKNAVVTGAFFILATVAAIIGLSLYDPILNSAHLTEGAGHHDQIILGAVFELALACTAVGTAFMLFPYLKTYSESWALGYVCFRLLEVVFILVGMVSVLALLSLSVAVTKEINPEATYFQPLGETLKAIHGWAFLLGPNFMLGINTLIYSVIFYRSKLVPGKLSVFGIIAAILIFSAALLQMFDVIQPLSQPHILLSIPIAVFEMVLAGWLIRVGFNKSYKSFD